MWLGNGADSLTLCDAFIFQKRKLRLGPHRVSQS